jgi:hypothetical protein
LQVASVKNYGSCNIAFSFFTEMKQSQFAVPQAAEVDAMA